MPNKNIFCNIPWFELNINSDGSFDLCGCQNDKIIHTELGKEWNIKNMGIDEYWNSTRMQEKRRIKLGDTVDIMCKMCQMKDAAGYTSARQKENLKSVIFQDNFDRSFEQSPHRHLFTEVTESKIHSLHLNIGNTCNLACRFCSPEASSRIASFQKHVGWIDKDWKLENWLKDPIGYQNFRDWFDKNYKHIKVVHIIGGEPYLIDEFADLIDLFSEHKMTWLNLSFTTNGTHDYTEFKKQFKEFKRVEIGISIETADASNNYIRQGSDIEEILNNVTNMQKKMKYVDLTFRTVPTWLSVGRYTTLLNEALKRRIPVDASYPHRPSWMLSELLPDGHKGKAIEKLQDFADNIKLTGKKFNNTKNKNNVELALKREAEALIQHLQRPVGDEDEAFRRRAEAASRITMQDRFHGISILDYIPEYNGWLREHGYTN